MGRYLYAATEGTETFYTIENDLLKIRFSNKGGRVASVELKDYKTYRQTPLLLFADSTSVFDLSFFIKKGYNNTQINTSEYYFEPVDANGLAFAPGEEQKNFAMRLNVDSASYVEYLYTIRRDNYMIDFDVRFVGMDDLLAPNQGDLEINWQNVGPQNEKGFDNENNYTTIAYNFPGDNTIEELGMSKETKDETVNSKIKWVAFKQQFFSSILIAGNDFQNATLQYETFAPGSGNIKQFHAQLSVPYTPQTDSYGFSFYFGPNKYSTLKKYDDLHLQRLVPLGGWIIGWVNRWLVIPTFDFLGKYIANYGLIILLLTIFIKIIISPLTYKSYLSTAKMRLLKPEMDKINDKRRQIFDYYYEHLAVLEEKGYLARPYVPDYAVRNGHMSCVRVKDLKTRTDLIRYMKEKGVLCVFHYIPLHSAPAGKQYGTFHGEDVYTTKESESLMPLPMYYSLSMDDVKYVTDCLLEYYGE